jgi:D-alanine-D-alanine ligase
MSADQNPWGRIGVLMGGYSSEREISLRSGRAIAQALKEEACDVVSVDITDQDEKKISKQIVDAGIDVAFIALHGKLGEDGTIQAILDQLEIPYTGSGAKASRRAINKIITQELLKNNSLPVAASVSLKSTQPVDEARMMESLGSYPWVVKPACEGSSIGVKVVKNHGQLEEAVEAARKFDDDVLVEKFIQGREVTVGILDEQPLPVIEIRFKTDFFDFTTKYQSNSTEYIVPALLPENIAQQLQRNALKAYHVLGCEDLCRVDMILGEDHCGYILEVNTIPGFTSSSLLPKAAKAAGLSFNRLCLKLVTMAYGKKERSKTSR